MKTSARKRFVLVLILVGLAWLAYSWLGSDSNSEHQARGDESPALLFDRPWIDSFPQKKTDYMHVFIALSDAPIGLFQKSSDYHGEAEIFEYRSGRGSNIGMVFPQHNNSVKARYRIHRCDEIRGLDLCLDFKKSPWGSVTRYYSTSDNEKLAELKATTGITEKLQAFIE